MALAAGLFTVLAVAASSAGWWVLAALPLAGVLAWAAGAPSVPRGRAGAVLTTARQWCLLVLCATVPAAYLVPGATSVSAVNVGYAVVALAVPLVASVADALGASLPERMPRWAVAVGLGLAAAFAAVCVAIAPATPTWTSAEPPSAFGPLVAVVLVLPLFSDLRAARLVAGVMTSSVVLAAALHQVGPIRFGLSPTSLRDVLVAADASALVTMLVVIAVVVGGLGALRYVGRLRKTGERITGRTGWSGLAVGAVAAACVAAAVLGPVLAAQLAGVVTLADVAYRLVRRDRGERTSGRHPGGEEEHQE
jgi:hypothetical protein